MDRSFKSVASYEWLDLSSDDGPADDTLVWRGSALSAQPLPDEGPRGMVSVWPAPPSSAELRRWLLHAYAGGHVCRWLRQGRVSPAFGNSLISVAALPPFVGEAEMLGTLWTGSGSSLEIFAKDAAAYVRACSSASDGVGHVQPWVTDGTSADTAIIADIAPGVDDSSPRVFAPTRHGMDFATEPAGRHLVDDGHQHSPRRWIHSPWLTRDRDQELSVKITIGECTIELSQTHSWGNKSA